MAGGIFFHSQQQIGRGHSVGHTGFDNNLRPERADGGVLNEHFLGVEVGAVALRAARRPFGFAKNPCKRWSLQRFVEKFTEFCDWAAGEAGKKFFIGMSGLANQGTDSIGRVASCKEGSATNI